MSWSRDKGNMFNYLDLEPELCDFVPVGPTSDLGTSGRLFVEIDGNPIVIFNIAGKYFAIGDLCSHDDGPLGDGDLQEFEVVCPRHGARFDVRTGKATALPAVVDIPAYPIRVVNEILEVGIPKDK